MKKQWIVDTCVGPEKLQAFLNLLEGLDGTLFSVTETLGGDTSYYTIIWWAQKKPDEEQE